MRTLGLALVVFVLGGVLGAEGMRFVLSARFAAHAQALSARAKAAVEKSTEKSTKPRIQLETDFKDGKVTAERVKLTDGRVIPVPPEITAERKN